MRSNLRWLLCGLSVCLAATLYSCGGSDSATLETAAPTELALEQMLAQVETVEPPGVAPDVADGLRKSLSSALRASGQTRFASGVAVSGIDDFTVTSNGDGTATVRWTYRNT